MDGWINVFIKCLSLVLSIDLPALFNIICLLYNIFCIGCFISPFSSAFPHVCGTLPGDYCGSNGYDCHCLCQIQN